MQYNLHHYFLLILCQDHNLIFFIIFRFSILIIFIFGIIFLFICIIIFTFILLSSSSSSSSSASNVSKSWLPFGYEMFLGWRCSGLFFLNNVRILLVDLDLIKQIKTKDFHNLMMDECLPMRRTFLYVTTPLTQVSFFTHLHCLIA